MTPLATSTQGTEHSNHGVVTSVRGSVVDVRFEDSLPPIYSLLRTGKEAQVAIEVLMQLRLRIFVQRKDALRCKATIRRNSRIQSQLPRGKCVGVGHNSQAQCNPMLWCAIACK